MSKKFLALALALLMIVGCFTVAASATQFSDDKAIKDYRTEITVLGALGLFQGYQGTGEFGADKPILRREACILFARILTGETSAEYAQANFMGTENYTPFTDLDAEGDFYGAISLAANEGLIIGWTDAESNQLVFNPNGNISYQDFLVMAVRLLNYGEKTIIKELDATYPWSYINKAIQTGLTRGVKGVQTNEEPISRGVAAKIIYNLLFSCVWPNCGSDLFFIRNLFAKKNVSFDTYYVTGKSQKDFKDNSNYYLLKSLTGKTDDVLVSEKVIEFPASMTVTDMYGTAFEVVCLNGEAIATNALPYAIFHENDITLDKENVVINGVKYALASAYNFPTEAVEQKHIWVKDDSLPTIFIQNFADWSVITNNAAMKVEGKDPLYETMVAFDDNNDGIYDRAAYAYETLWNYTAPDGKGNIGGILTGVKNRVSAANGDIVRGFSVGATDAFSKYLVINGKYAPQTAKVMKYDFTSGKVWLADSSANTNMWWDVEGEGTAYSLGLDGLKGITLGTTYVDTIVESLLQNITFYAEGNQIFKVNTKSTGYFIFDEFVSYDFSGYINMRVMDPATGKYTIIKVTTVDNYPYYSFAGTAFGDKWNTYGNDVTDIFDFGDVVAYVTDGTGTYNVFDMETALDNGKAPAVKTNGISIVNNDKNTIKRIIAMDDQLGLVSIDLAKSDAAATVTIASGVEYVALGNTLYVFDAVNGCVDATGIVDGKVAQNGANGGIYDVVYYDGSLMSNVKIDAIKDGGALVGYSTVWTYTDVKGVKGFASFTADNEKNLVVNSYNRITKPGFYTLIQMNDGSVWFGDAIAPADAGSNVKSNNVCCYHLVMADADVAAVKAGNAYTFNGTSLVEYTVTDDVDAITAIYYYDHVVYDRNTLQTIDADLSMLATDKDGKPVLNDAKLYIVCDLETSERVSTLIGERFEKKTGYDQHAAVSYTNLIDDFTDGANTSDADAQALILFFANQTTADELYENGELVNSVETTALIDLSKISAKLYAASSAKGLGDFIADCTLTEVATYDDDTTDGRYVVKVEANAIAGNGIYTIENGKLTQIATGLNKSTPIILSYNTKYFNTVGGYEYCLDDALEADTNGTWNYGVIRVTYGDLSVDYNVLFSLGETVVG